MGKGYNNYMCKKPFHPGSKANIKRAWMAEQKTENEKRKQEELKTQYEKEQDLYNNRALVSSESKDKLQLNFMYEAPPGAKREHQKEDDEPEFKFEWQRKYNAPREDYAKGNEDIKDQPFGIPVRNVRCIKCHKWGHINTDKECPLYHQASTSSMPTTSMDPLELMRQMKEDGFGLKENVLGHQLNPAAANQQFIPSDDESDPEIDFLKSLSSAEKKKLLKKLKKLSKKQERSSNCKKKKKSKKTKKSKSRASYSSDSEKEKKAKKKKSKKSSSSDSDSSSDESEKRESKKSKHSEPKEKQSQSEKKNSKEHTNNKEAPFNTRNYEHHSREKYNKKMCEEESNLHKSASKEDNENKRTRHDPKQESLNHKFKPIENKHQSQEKYNRNTNSKEDNEHQNVKNEFKHKSSDHGKHKRGSEEDLNLNIYTSKKDTVHKKVNESRMESSDHCKHKNREDKHEKKIKDTRVEKRARNYSSNSDEEKYPPIKSKPCDTAISPTLKRKSEACLNKEDSILTKHASKEDTVHKKANESWKESSDPNKHKTREDKHEKKIKDSRTEKKVRHSNISDEEDYPEIKSEPFSDTDVSLTLKRKSEAFSFKEDSIKEDMAHKKAKSLQASFDQDKNKLIETKHDIKDSQTEHKGNSSEPEKHRTLDREVFVDDNVSPLKRKPDTSTSEYPSNMKKSKYDHPDGFSHLCPQAHIKMNYLQPSEEYEGEVHDHFRHHYRDERSPSVKQKYNK